MFLCRFKFNLYISLSILVMDMSFGCSIGFGAKSCFKLYYLDWVKHSQGIGFGIMTVEFFSFACQINV